MNGTNEADLPLDQWLADVSGAGWLWYVKYLSGNDTYATNAHQAGPYISKALLASAFGDLVRRSRLEENPDLRLPSFIDSHGWDGTVRAVWYNSKIIKQQPNGRDEARLTGWGGKENPLLEPNATGSLVVFAFQGGSEATDPAVLRIWIAQSAEQSDRILDAVGEVEPGVGIIWSPMGYDHGPDRGSGTCELTFDEIPAEWIERFPSGEEIIKWVLTNRDPWRLHDPDSRLTRRRSCEYDVFRSIERYHVLPRIQKGFETVDAFIEYSNAVNNRRKARAGRSLELHLREIFNEQKVEYSWTPKTEGARRPDFIFPSIDRYWESAWPSDRLFMLAAKTTCKDRWRQILNEAERIPKKHLLTLQEGISVDQHREMVEEGVQLVVPSKLVSSYPPSIRPSLMSLAAFIELVENAA